MVLAAGSRRRSGRRLWWVLGWLALAAAVLAVLGFDVERFLYGGARVLRVGAPAGPLVVSPDGRTVYLAGSTDSITPVSAVTGKPGKPIAIGGGGRGGPGVGQLAITPDGRTLFASVFTDDPLAQLARVDLRTGREAGPVRIPGGAFDFALSRDGATLYVAGGDDALTVVDAATGRIERRIPVLRSLAASEVAMVVSPDGGTLYLASDLLGGEITPVSLRTGAVGRAISVGWEPVSLAITPDGRTLYAAIDGLEGDSGQAAPNRVVAIDTAAGRVRASLPWRAPPVYLAMAPDGTTVWVASTVGATGSTAENTVTPVSVASGQPGPSFHASGWLNTEQDGPTGIAVSPSGRTLYVTVPAGLETFAVP